MRVVIAENIADHAGAFEVPAVRSIATVIHRIQHAAVNGLESVGDVRERSANDDAHRVVEVRTLHFGLDLDRFNPSVRSVILLLVGQSRGVVSHG